MHAACAIHRLNGVSAALALTLTVSLTLRADVVAEHSAEHEVFFGREQVERSCHNHAYGVKALLSAEIQVQAIVANGLYDVFYVLAFQSAYGALHVQQEIQGIRRAAS